MSRRAITLPCAVLTTAVLTLTAVPASAAPSGPQDDQAPEHGAQAVPPRAELSLLGSYETKEFDASASEIPAFDPLTQRAFVVNALSGAIDVFDLSDPSEVTYLETLSTVGAVAADGSVVPEGAIVNSVKVHADWIAVATEAPNKVDPGWALFYSTDGEYLSGVRVGSLPDMITATPDGSYALVANEGEPADDFSSDPEGSVSVITLDDVASLTQDDVRTARFTAYDEGTELPEGVRVFGPDVDVPEGHEPAGRVARNLEPEYIVTDSSGTTAYAALQEANAIAVIDIASAQVTDVWAIPGKDWSTGDNVFDASDRDDAINLQNWPVTGLAMPDGIAIYEVDGQSYIVTANEGDAREWGDYEEPVRIGSDDYPLCADAFGGEDAVAELKAEQNLGRLNATIADGLREGDDCYEEIFVFGARSFSILTTDGELVYDSAGIFEQTIAELIDAGELPEHAFNANNSATPSFDTRSDDKGPEPEDVAIGQVGGTTVAFIGLERIGGVITFDITDPHDVRYLDYVNNRNWDIEVDEEYVEGMGDLGAEGLEFVPINASPTGEPFLIVSNEVSGSTTTFAVNVLSAERLAGVDRYATAAELSEEYTPLTTEVAYVATGQTYADALVAGALAGTDDAPVLLTRSDHLPEVTRAELERIAPQEIVVLGGPVSVQDEVLSELAGLAGAVTRVDGADRYEVAEAAAARQPGDGTVVVASGQGYADALVGSAVAGAQGAPVLLTKADHLPAATVRALQTAQPEQILLLGGPESVSPQVETLLTEYAPVQRVGGADRYQVAAGLSEGFEPGVGTVFVATGQGYTDALAAAAIAGGRAEPVLLTRGDHLPAATGAALERLQPSRIVVLGGPDTIDEAIVDLLASYLPQ